MRKYAGEVMFYGLLSGGAFSAWQENAWLGIGITAALFSVGNMMLMATERTETKERKTP